MHLPNNWWDVAFLACLPLIFIILAFGWLVFMSRGKRAVSINLSGFGVSLKLDSNDLVTKPSPLESGVVNA